MTNQLMTGNSNGCKWGKIANTLYSKQLEKDINPVESAHERITMSLKTGQRDRFVSPFSFLLDCQF